MSFDIIDILHGRGKSVLRCIGCGTTTDVKPRLAPPDNLVLKPYCVECWGKEARIGTRMMKLTQDQLHAIKTAMNEVTGLQTCHAGNAEELVAALLRAELAVVPLQVGACSNPNKLRQIADYLGPAYGEMHNDLRVAADEMDRLLTNRS